jgi:membrane associated rhomboid family serine protease|tara:strand:+ start:20963 stop:21745 length:783 start_codon:yes stop_codon:yes gene_type:complete
MFSFLNNIPQVTKNFLLLNVLLFVLMQFFLASGGIDLSRYLASHYIGTPLFEPYQVISHMFMHSPVDFMHIIFNMLLLVMFGAHLERLWGPKRFFIFYFAAGLGAFALDNIVHGIQVFDLVQELKAVNVDVSALNNLIVNIGSMSDNAINEAYGQIVTGADAHEAATKYLHLSLMSGVGASGAIFGLLAAFAILFPNTELYLMFIPVPIKAKYMIGAYVLFELYNSFAANDNINHLAHLGGALVGTIIVLIWRKKSNNFY